jgi:hypothetical protein
LRLKKVFAIIVRILPSYPVFFVGLLGLTNVYGQPAVHGALKVSAGPEGPWIVTNDGAIYAYTNFVWNQIDTPGTADDLALCGAFLTILTKPDAQGKRTVKSRNISGGSTWTAYPSLGAIDIIQVACDGYAPVALAASPDRGVYKYDKNTESWLNIHDAATGISVENGRLFFLYPTTTHGNVWSRYVNGGPYTQWGETMVANKIAGDANGFPWIATNAASNPLYKWDTENKKWTFGFTSGPVYDMDIQSYVKMYILSDPLISGGGYTLYSHDLYSGGWTTCSLPGYQQVNPSKRLRLEYPRSK